MGIDHFLLSAVHMMYRVPSLIHFEFLVEVQYFFPSINTVLMVQYQPSLKQKLASGALIPAEEGAEQSMRPPSVSSRSICRSLLLPRKMTLRFERNALSPICFALFIHASSSFAGTVICHRCCQARS